MAHSIPDGFRLTGVHSGIKQDKTREDISLVCADVPCVAAGVYTQNRVVAAPVILDRQRTPSDSIRAVVTNSGNANACTGEQGMADAQQMAAIAATACDVKPTEVLVMSTGIIGEHLPMDTIRAGIEAAASQLGNSEQELQLAARGMMTTDTHPKIASRTLNVDGQNIAITGLAKGAAMIGPNMATMLGLILTDAKISSLDAQSLLGTAVQDSFNCITVEGHTSTNDTVLLLASGKANASPLTGSMLEEFRSELNEICIELARSIPGDGEGATHLIEINVCGCSTRERAYKIAKAVADSPLVKTAVAGADPNWGRIVSAAGYAGVDFDPGAVKLELNGTLIYQNGMPVAFAATSLSDSIRANRDTSIVLTLQEGTENVRFWTCDLTAEYVRLNADYHT